MSSGLVAANYRATLYDPRGRFTLAKDQQIKDIVLKLIPQAVVTGRVLDAEGKPMEGARVSLLKASSAGGVARWAEVAFAQTLDNGEYRIPRVGPGRYLVKCTVPSGEFVRMPPESEVETGYAATYHSNVTDPSLARQIEVLDAREIRGVDVQLNLARLFHVRGNLELPNDGWHNITGQFMLLDRANPSQVVATVKTTSPNLQFDLAHIPPGSYLAYAKLDETPVYQAQQVVDVTAGDVDGLVLRVRRSDPIPGVLQRKPDDRQVDLRKIAVRFPANWIGTDPGAGYTPVQIGSDLTFRGYLSDLFGFSSFRVQVSDLPDGCYLFSISYGGVQVPESGVEYMPDATLVITIGVDGGRVDGTVAGDDDRPLGRAVVGLFPADGKGKPASLQADAKGAFHFNAVPPGDHNLIAWGDVSRDDLENPHFVNRFANNATAISVTANGSATAALKIVSK
ncbi:MAG TPA: carboxypeptidase regulatory-like domain-containing protein [Bryobacteraceae bacterium]|nr:carboxypeptidase regulatory-like domain-containing protein [Bryobacteraceae bacterium]